MGARRYGLLRLWAALAALYAFIAVVAGDTQSVLCGPGGIGTSFPSGTGTFSLTSALTQTSDALSVQSCRWSVGALGRATRLYELDVSTDPTSSALFIYGALISLQEVRSLFAPYVMTVGDPCETNIESNFVEMVAAGCGLLHHISLSAPRLFMSMTCAIEPPCECQAAPARILFLWCHADGDSAAPDTLVVRLQGCVEQHASAARNQGARFWWRIWPW